MAVRVQSASIINMAALNPFNIKNESTIIELRQQELPILLTILDHSNSPMHSLPIRHMLWYQCQNIITDGYVYVDQWPAFKNVCSLHMSRPFITGNNLDFDVATFYQVGNEFNARDFQIFIQDLSTERKWLTRGVLGCYVPIRMVESIESVLGNRGNLATYDHTTMCTVMERENLPKYRQRMAELKTGLPKELKLDILRPSDVQKIIKYRFGPSHILPHFYRWLVVTFPSACLRHGNEPVAWGCSYSCGSGCNLFVKPEYRGRNVVEYIALAQAVKLYDFSPLQLYFTVASENAAMHRATAKTFMHDFQKGCEIKWFYFSGQSFSSNL